MPRKEWRIQKHNGRMGGAKYRLHALESSMREDARLPVSRMPLTMLQLQVDLQPLQL
jgi:hypothetical protein